MNEWCDARKCGARAYVKADLRGTGTLYYCAHHGAQYMDELVTRGFEITDERDKCQCECTTCQIARLPHDD